MCTDTQNSDNGHDVLSDPDPILKHLDDLKEKSEATPHAEILQQFIEQFDLHLGDRQKGIPCWACKYIGRKIVKGDRPNDCPGKNHWDLPALQYRKVKRTGRVSLRLLRL